MDFLTLLQPTGANKTASPGPTGSSGTAGGASGFEQLLASLVTPGITVAQGAAQTVAGTVSSVTTASASATAAATAAANGVSGTVDLLAGATNTQPVSVVAETGRTGLTGAAVLGVDAVLPTVGNGNQASTKAASQTKSAIKGATNSVTTALTAATSATGQATATIASGQAAAQTAVKSTGIKASAGKPGASLTSATQGQPATGALGQQAAATPAAASAVTSALKDKTATPGETVKKPASPAGASSEVVTAKTAIKSAVIDAPGAGKKTAKKGAKSIGIGAKPAKSGKSVAPAPQAQNGSTVAQIAQTAAKTNALKAGAPSSNVQTTELFGPAPTAVVTSGGEVSAIAQVSNVAASSGAEPIVTTASARAAASFTPVPQQVAIQFSQAITEGADRITIQLHPESLGRVEVEIELGKDGRLSAVFLADRPETLDMLQRDSRALERALNEAGMRTDADGLSFSLRGEGGQSQEFGNSSGGTDGNAGGPSDGVENDGLMTPRGPILNVNAMLDIQV